MDGSAMSGVSVVWAGERAVLVRFEAEGDGADVASIRRRALGVRAVRDAIAGSGVGWVEDVVAGVGSVLVVVDAVAVSGVDVAGWARGLAVGALGEGGGAVDEEVGGAVVEVPVWYGGEAGPDLGWLAGAAGMDAGEVVSRHAGGVYVAECVGFSPGFGYLGGLDRGLWASRRGVPRRRVAAGSVGVAGRHTAVYPLATAGGWRLIGRTPLRMFDASRASPALVGVGDAVRFRAIDREAYEGMLGGAGMLSRAEAGLAGGGGGVGAA